MLLIIMSFRILYIWSNVAAKCKFMSWIFIKFEDMVHEAKKATFFCPLPKAKGAEVVGDMYPYSAMEVGDIVHASESCQLCKEYRFFF